MTRLERLEAATLTRWRKAWEHSAVVFDKHAGGIIEDSAELRAALERDCAGMTGDEVEAAGVAFLAHLGVRGYRAFETWFNSYELPEDSPPDLTCWPGDIPTPPDELPGEWDKAAPYRLSSDPVEQLAAQLFLFMLASARAVREERAGVGVDTP